MPQLASTSKPPVGQTHLALGCSPNHAGMHAGPNGKPPSPFGPTSRADLLRLLTPRWQQYQAQTHRAALPTPARTSSGLRNATAAALDERWANHWKAKTARATGPVPTSAAALVATLNDGVWPFASSTPVTLVALVAPVAPAAPAAPADTAVAPAAPAAFTAPAEPVATADTISANGLEETMLTEVLDAMTEVESFEVVFKTEEESFKELLEDALVPS